jgi:glycosyl transferase family 4
LPIKLRRGVQSPIRDVAALIELIRLYRREKPNIVHHVALKQVLFGAIAVRIVRVPAMVNAITGLGYMFVLGPGAAGFFVRLAVEAFLSELPHRAKLDSSRILFVVNGMRPDIYSESDFQRAQGSYFDLMRQYFMNAAVEQAYEVIDMQPLFIARYRKDGLRFERPSDAHWTGLGHQMVAEAVASSKWFQRLCDCVQ